MSHDFVSCFNSVFDFKLDTRFGPAPEWISLVEPVLRCQAAQTNRVMSKEFTLVVDVSEILAYTNKFLKQL